MSVFGVQAVVSLIFLSFLQKICPIYSFGRWLLTKQNLVRYLHPTDEELKNLAGNPNRASNGKKSRKAGRDPKSEGDSFTLPRSIELSLSSSPLSALDVLPLRFYSEFVWLMDFTIITALVVTLTYIYEHHISPQSNEYGLSALWCFLLINFSLKPLLSIVSSYKISQNSGEIVLCCIFGFFFLVSAMVILIIDDKTLEFHIVSAHDKFTTAANEFLSKRELSTIGSGSLVTFRTILAIISGFVGALLTFPGLRVARCHIDSLVMIQDRPFMQVLMYIDFLIPIFLLSLWVPPISRNPVLGKSIPGTDIIVSEATFDVCRDLAILLFLVFRILLLKHRLQAYLNTACTKLDSMRKEAGRVTNVEIQSSVTQIFYYLCVVTIQLIAPVTLLAGTLMMSRSFASADVAATNATTAEDVGKGSEDLLHSMQDQVQGFTVTLAELRSVFSSHLLQCVSSYFIWFSVYSWTVTSYFGMFYHTYLVRT